MISKPVARVWRQGFRRDREMTVSEWADTHRILSPIASAEPGRWRTSRTPYLRAIMDALSPGSPYDRVVFQKGAQVGGTEVINNWLGHIIHCTPGPVLYVEPTLDMAKKVSRQRINPMVAASPVLSGLVAETRSRDSSNTVLMKEFANGLLIMAGANSPAALRSMPIRFLLCDEVDEYPGDVGGQGDPVSLAEKRTATFARRKVVLTSTPTATGLSRIEREYLASDQRRYFVPCPKCGHMDYIQWSLGGRKGNEGTHHHMVWEGRDPNSIRLCCSGCGVLIEERWKTQMLTRGEWRATAVSTNPRTVGFHLSSLYSPHGWKRWSECLSEFFAAKDDPFKLRTWVNTVLGETFEEEGDALEPATLKSRRAAYGCEVPDGVGILVAGVDVQGDRLEAAVYGFGEGEEGWLIAFEQLLGSPKLPETWFKLDTFLAQKFRRSNGVDMMVERTAIDSGGHHTEEVYRYTTMRIRRGIYPVKGGPMAGKPLVDRPSTKNKYRVPLFILCTDTGKDLLLGRLQMKRTGPGYIHLPEWVDDEFIDQLTAERAVRRYQKGRGFVREWTKIRERNEALDITVYAIAALHICGQAFIKLLGKRASAFAAKQPAAEPPAPPPAETDTLTNRINQSLQQRRPRPKGWVNDY